MSYWTHITACISVDTCLLATRPQLKKLVKEYLAKAPKITGSEGDADIFINVQSGYNSYVSHDCDHCKYKDQVKYTLAPDGFEYLDCEKAKGRDCSAEHQSCIVITVQGDLRDRVKATTRKEFNAFLKYVKKEYVVRDYALNIE